MNYLEPTIEYGIDYNIPRKISLEPKQIETEQRRLEKLKKLKHFDEIISVLKHYISNFIPNPRKYENFLWFISCYPKPNVEFRLTIYWQEILTLAYSQNLMLILDTRRITKKELKLIAQKVRSIEIKDDRYYKKGLPTQLCVLIKMEDYFEFVSIEKVADSIRLYNRELLEKGKIVHPGHNYILASLILEKENNLLLEGKNASDLIRKQKTTTTLIEKQYPTEESAFDIKSKYEEGNVIPMYVNRYERNQKAKNICIKHYGAFCQGCGFDFGKVYGAYANGFIHVHHLKPLSEINKTYLVDPIKDLIPLCANCHSAVHLSKPILTIDKLKKNMKILTKVISI